MNPQIISLIELEANGYNDARAATQGHLELCEKWDADIESMNGIDDDLQGRERSCEIRLPEALHDGVYRCNPDGTFTKLDSNVDFGPSSDENRT